MYNKYTYDFSKPTAMNMNVNIKECFEQTDVSSVYINKILNDINSKFTEQMEEEKVEEVPSTSFKSTRSKYTSSKKYK